MQVVTVLYVQMHVILHIEQSIKSEAIHKETVTAVRISV